MRFLQKLLNTMRKLSNKNRNFFLFSIVFFLLFHCSNKTTAERCEELESYLDARSRVESDCEIDSDCQVIYVRPDRPIAGRSGPNDPELRTALQSYRESCDDLPEFTGVVTAVCEEIPFDLDDPSAISEDEELEFHCVLQGDVPELDVGFDVQFDPDAIDCRCDVASECEDDFVCACDCVPISICAEICAKIYTCGELQMNGFGRTGEACVASCETQVSLHPELVECMNESVCGQFQNCL